MKLNSTISAPTDKAGQPIDITQRSEGVDTTKFEIVPPGYYFALVHGLKMDTYQAPWKGVPNPATADGKWTYVKITPDLELFNANGTVVNRQETTVGVLEGGNFYRPDQDSTKSEIWVEAQYLLRSLGLLSKGNNGKFVLNFDSELIHDRVVSVRTGVAGYIKGQRTVSAKTLTAMLTEQNQGEAFEFGDIPELVRMYNEDHGTELKTKNVIEAYYDVAVVDAQERGWFVEPDSGAVFVSEASWNQYLTDLDTPAEAF